MGIVSTLGKPIEQARKYIKALVSTVVRRMGKMPVNPASFMPTTVASNRPAVVANNRPKPVVNNMPEPAANNTPAANVTPPALQSQPQPPAAADEANQ